MMFGKRPNELTVEDIERLVAEQVQEGSQLEIKGALPDSSGRPDPWSEGEDRVSEYARNQLVAEVIAFANAHGGWLLVGVTETQAKPARAEAIAPIRDCAELAERLRLQCRDCIEPRLPVLEAEGVPTRVDGAGVVVFHVPRSRMAPHRHTANRECYFRRADRTEKMTMREIQDLTIQTERGMAGVEAALEKRRADFAPEPGQFAIDGALTWGARVTGIPTMPLFIERVHGNESVRPPSINIAGEVQAGQIELFVPADGVDWRPVLRGTQCAEDHGDLRCVRQIYCDGLVEYRLLNRREGDPFRILPSWIMGLATNAMCAVERFRCVAGAPDVEYALDIEIRIIGGDVRVTRYGRHPPGYIFGPLPEGEIRFPMYSLGPRDGFGQVAALFERDFWNAVGVDQVREVQVDFDAAFRELGLLA